jgi:hypothetical protein
MEKGHERMQKPSEKRQNGRTEEKEVIAFPGRDGMAFLGMDCKLYIFDGEQPPRLYAEVIPVIRKRKRKKGPSLEFARTCDSKSAD